MTEPNRDEAWYQAWEPVVVLAAARVHRIDVDRADVLAGYDPTAVVGVLVELVGRILDSFPSGGGADVVENWGAIVASRGAVHAARPDAERGTP